MHFNQQYSVSFRAVQIAAITTTGRIYSGPPFQDINGKHLTDDDWAWVNRMQIEETIRASFVEGKKTTQVNWWVKDAMGGSHLMGAGDYLVYTDDNRLYTFPQATFEYLFKREA